MKRLNQTACLSIAILAAILPLAAYSADDDDKTPWDVVSIGAASIGVPNGWRKLNVRKATMPLILTGDGIGVPAVDETGAPLQIGLTVEKFPDTSESPREIASGLIDLARKNPRLDQVGKESMQTVKLADGAEAILLKAEFIKEGRRRSLQMKLVTKDSDSNAWIATGYVVGGKASKLPTPKSRLTGWLEAHLTSLSLDGSKFDAKNLRAAYKERDE